MTLTEPDVPENVRAYVSHDNDALRRTKAVLVELQWAKPENANGLLGNYFIYEGDPSGDKCLHRRRLRSVPADDIKFRLSYPNDGRTLCFLVSASTAAGEGETAGPVFADTSLPNPVPYLMFSNESALNLLEPDAMRERGLRPIQQLSSFSLSAAENALYTMSDTNEVAQWDLTGGTGSGHTLWTTERSAHQLDLDWVSRRLYWVERDAAEGDVIMGFELDRPNIPPWPILTVVNPILQLHVSPLSNTIFYSHTTSLWQTDLSLAMSSPVFSQRRQRHNRRWRRRLFAGQLRQFSPTRRCNCPRINGNLKFVIDHVDMPGNIYLIDGGGVWKSDLSGCSCKLVYSGTGTAAKTSMVTVDHRNFYWYSSPTGILRSVNKHSGLEYRQHQVKTMNQMQAYGVQLQPLPNLSCVLPNNTIRSSSLLARDANSLLLAIDRWTPPADVCEHISRPVVHYEAHYSRRAVESDDADCPPMDCGTVISFHPDVKISELRPYSNYSIVSRAITFYSEKENETEPSLPVLHSTGIGVPSAPRNVAAWATSPETVSVRWNAPDVANGPPQQLEYGLEYETAENNGKLVTSTLWSLDKPDKPDRLDRLDKPDKPDKPEKSGQNGTDLLLRNSPDTDLLVRVLARHAGQSLFTRSSTVKVRTFPNPNPIHLVNTTETTVRVKWSSPPDGSIVRVKFLINSLLRHQTSAMEIFKESFSSVKTVLPNSSYSYTFRELYPGSSYAISIAALYGAFKKVFIWPKDQRFQFSTRPAVPLRPEPPELRRTSLSVVSVTWNAPADQGRPITSYVLNSREMGSANWTTVYEGSEQRWRLQDLDYGKSYVFAVAAQNSVGLGPFSTNSSIFMHIRTDNVSSFDVLSLALILSFSLLMALLVVLVILFVVCRRHRRYHKGFFISSDGTGTTDQELATLRQLPGNHHTNLLYDFSSAPTEADVRALPHLSRSKLRLTRFLGSGAFGEVFEGVVNSLEKENDVPVAVKTLRKGASDQTKCEFVKEALLMSNFKHEHVISLLGVCLDNDPHYLILELMVLGDLLLFLRASRGMTTRTCQLSLSQLMRMCVDVARGCCYLEDMHFVHRDLAARNCLISRKSDEELIVKIGDFGLARDIYKSDYYRQEGERLLPVRWMSPEALADGVFTTQSDVWAFGVLMWEVLTLGKQPYPGRSNSQVLDWVRGGGRLLPPEQAPKQMYELMLRCWEFEPNERPSFAGLLTQLESCLWILKNCPSEQTVRALKKLRLRISGGSSDYSDGQRSDSQGYMEPNTRSRPCYLELLGDDAIDGPLTSSAHSTISAAPRNSLSCNSPSPEQVTYSRLATSDPAAAVWMPRDETQ